MLSDTNTQEFSLFSGGLGGRSDLLSPIQPTPYRKIRAQEFEPYLKSLTDVFEKYQLNRALGEVAMEGTPELDTAMDELDRDLKGLEDVVEKYLPNALLHGSAAKTSITKSQRARMLSVNAPSKDIIPAIFSDKNFDLENPNIFAAVTDYKDIIGVASPGASDASFVLQDTLTHYADTAEVYLLKEISRRAPAFFESLGHLKELDAETRECADQIAKLRLAVQDLEAINTTGPLNIVRLKRRHGNMTLLLNVVKSVGQLRDMQMLIKALLLQSDYTAALNLIDEASIIISGTSSTGSNSIAEAPIILASGISLLKSTDALPKTLDLTSLACFSTVRQYLWDVRNEIETNLTAEFIKIIEADIHSIQPPEEKSTTKQWISNIKLGECTSQNSAPTAIRSSTGSAGKPGGQHRVLHDKMYPLVRGLVRLNKMGAAIESLKVMLIKYTKTISNQLYPISFPKESSPKSIEEKAMLKRTHQAYLLFMQ